MCKYLQLCLVRGLPVENMWELVGEGERIERERITFIKPGKSQSLKQEKGKFP